MPKLEAFVVGRFQYNNVEQILLKIPNYIFPVVLYIPNNRAQTEDVWQQSDEKGICNRVRVAGRWTKLHK
jgi:hypothetical protein